MTDETPETHDEMLHRIAANLVLDQVQHLEFLTVVETHPELSEADAELVHDLALSATVRASWPSHDYVYGNTFEDEPIEDVTE